MLIFFPGSFVHPIGSPLSPSHFKGGAYSSRSIWFLFSVLRPHDLFDESDNFGDDDKIKFLRVQYENDYVHAHEVAFRVLLSILCVHLPVRNLRTVMTKHQVPPHSLTLEGMIQKCMEHNCDDDCVNLLSVFQRTRPSIEGLDSVSLSIEPVNVVLISPPEDAPDVFPFPPVPLTTEHCADLTNEWRLRISELVASEEACAVCARLTPLKALKVIDVIDLILQPLVNPSSNVARRTRLTISDPIVALNGPILYEKGLHHREGPSGANICSNCFDSLRAGRLPVYSLANGQWLGEVPDVLTRLNVAEQMMISLYRHNACVARVRMGQQRMVSNAVMFAQPVSEV